MRKTLLLPLLLVVAERVSGDACDDFCIAQLSRPVCSKGSWCKNNRDCHSLFWTGSDRSSICVFKGDSSCQNKFPVLCHEAEERMKPRQTSTSPPTTAPRIGPTDFWDGTEEEIEQRLRDLGILYETTTSRPSPALTTTNPPAALMVGSGHFDSREYSHVAVIPDVHGDAEFFLESLWIVFERVEPANHGVSKNRFFDHVRRIADSIEFPSGESTLSRLPVPLSKRGKRIALVQLGDIMDRGPRSFYSYRILASIESAIGWKLIQLAGNHDLMIYNPRSASFPDGFDLRYNHDPTDISNDQAKLLFGPGGDLSTYIIQKDLIVARIGTQPLAGDYRIDPRSPDTLFVHAGVDIFWADEYLKANGKAKKWEDLVSFLNDHQKGRFFNNLANAGSLANDETGPVFVRNIPESVGVESMRECARLQYLLEQLKVSRIIVGHTPDGEHRTREYCDSRFIITDVAMSRGMTRDGQPYALIMNLMDNGQKIRSMVAHYTHPDVGGLRFDQILLPVA
jgi:hypothetical protein